MDDARRHIEASLEITGGELHARCDSEIHFGDACLECGAISGVEACTCSTPKFGHGPGDLIRLVSRKSKRRPLGWLSAVEQLVRL